MKSNIQHLLYKISYLIFEIVLSKKFSRQIIKRRKIYIKNNKFIEFFFSEWNIPDFTLTDTNPFFIICLAKPKQSFNDYILYNQCNLKDLVIKVIET